MSAMKRVVAALRSVAAPPTRRHSSTSSPSLLCWRPDGSDNDVAGATTLELLTWGRGGDGQLGSGVEDTYTSPTKIADFRVPSDFRLSPVSGRVPAPTPETPSVEVGISCGLFHSALLIDGRIWVWGKGDGGRLGLGNEASVYAPVLNPNLEKIKYLALGGLHSTALTTNGEVYTWGYGGFGALGHTVYHRELLPRLVEYDWNDRICHLATSGSHTAAITSSGGLFTWGRDQGEGRLGLGSGGGPDEGCLGTPCKVDALQVPVAAVSCGGFFTMALTSDGQVWSWGGNSNYELGRGNKTSDWRPQLISALDGVCIVQIATGGFHTAALTDEGKVLTWGHGRQGQLGHGNTETCEVPKEIEALNKEHCVYIACGSSSTAAVTDKGKLYVWGYSKDCQLGIPGLPEIQSTPVEVKFLPEEDSSLFNVLSISIGATHAMCLASRTNS